MGESSDLRAVRTRSGSWGYVDAATGTLAIEPAFSAAWDFSEGRGCVVVGGERPAADRREVPLEGRYGFLDEQGDWTAEPEWDVAMWFREGLAPVNRGARRESNPRDPHEEAMRGGKWGFVDRAGRIAVEPQFDSVGHFREGLAVARRYGLLRFARSVGFLDPAGTWEIGRRFWTAGAFVDGLANAGVGSAPPRCGWIDRNGDWVVEPRYDSTAPFSDGLGRATLGMPPDTTTEYLDPSAAVVLRLGGEYAWARDFHEGLAAATDAPTGRTPRHFGFVGHDGAWAIEPGFDWVHGFSEGFAAVREGAAWRYIDRQGETAIADGLALASPVAGGVARVETSSGEMQLLDVSGRVLWRE